MMMMLIMKVMKIMHFNGGRADDDVMATKLIAIKTS